MKATNQLFLIKREDISDSVLSQVEQTYIEAFPLNERRDFELTKLLIANDPAFNLYTFTQDDVYVGFITTWQFADFLYVEHFAIDNARRSGGIGSKALMLLIEETALPILLEVELPLDEMAKRRIQFYERLEFKFHNYPYQQPPYSEGQEWVELRFMTRNKQNRVLDFDVAKACLYRSVYRVSEDV